MFLKNAWSRNSSAHFNEKYVDIITRTTTRRSFSSQRLQLLITSLQNLCRKLIDVITVKVLHIVYYIFVITDKVK